MKLNRLFIPLFFICLGLPTPSFGMNTGLPLSTTNNNNVETSNIETSIVFQCDNESKDLITIKKIPENWEILQTSQTLKDMFEDASITKLEDLNIAE